MTDFGSLHRAGDPLILPNAWDVASARMLAGAGFPAIGTTSLGVAAANGLPDGEGATDADMVRLVRGVAGLPCHVTVDIERRSPSTTRVEVTARKNVAEWDKDLARRILDRFVKD